MHINAERVTQLSEALIPFVWRQAVQSWPLCHFAVIRGPRIVVRFITANITFLLLIFKNGAGLFFLGTLSRVLAF